MTQPIGLFLRVFAEAPDIPSAMGAASHLLGLVGIKATALKIQPYWKVNDWQEITLELEAADCAAAFRTVADRLSPRWLFGGAEDDPDALWAQSDHGASLMGPAIKWAHLQFHFPPTG